jgi:hypothetical protein
MSNALFIGYARPNCDKSLVKSTFASILGADYITNIYEKNRTNKFGKYKTFLIIFINEFAPGLEDIIKRITCEQFIKLVYKQDWDWKKRKYVERYWKVFIPYTPTAEFKPRIMDAPTTFVGWDACPEDDMPELEESTPLPPNFFGENSQVSRPYDDDRSVQLGNPTYVGRDPATGADLYKKSKLDYIGTSGRVWLGCSCKPGEYNPLCDNRDDSDSEDTNKDFAELEAAIEKYGEDFKWSIAPKIPPAPPVVDEYDEEKEEIVWQKLQQEVKRKLTDEVSILEEDAEWNELKAALDEFGASEVYPYMSQSELQAVCDEFNVTMPASGGERIREVICPPPPQLKRATAIEFMETPHGTLLDEHGVLRGWPKMVRSDDTQADTDAYYFTQADFDAYHAGLAALPELD